MPKSKTVFEDCDILVVGGGMAGTGATFESRYWGRDLKIICVEKANIDRSGAVAQGLYAINCCLLYTSPSPRDQRGSRMPSSA